MTDWAFYAFHWGSHWSANFDLCHQTDLGFFTVPVSISGPVNINPTCSSSSTLNGDLHLSSSIFASFSDDKFASRLMSCSVLLLIQSTVEILHTLMTWAIISWHNKNWWAWCPRGCCFCRTVIFSARTMKYFIMNCSALAANLCGSRGSCLFWELLLVRLNFAKSLR